MIEPDTTEEEPQRLGVLKTRKAFAKEQIDRNEYRRIL